LIAIGGILGTFWVW